MLDLLFSDIRLEMPMETARIFLAILGMMIASYYDLFKNKNVPERFLYAFLGIAFFFNVVFFDYEVFVYSVILGAVVGAIGFALYRLGQFGGADVFVVVSVILLLPVYPSYLKLPYKINPPFILAILIFGVTAFAVWLVFDFARTISKQKAKPNLIYAPLFLLYALVAYVFLTTSFFSGVYFGVASILMLSTIVYLMYRNTIVEATMKQVFIKDLEPEDVVVRERMDSQLKKMNIGPVLSQKDIDALRKSGTKYIWIYANLPPFLPFLTIGLLIALFLGDAIFPVFY